MAVGPSSSATSPGSAGVKAYEDLSRYFAWDSGDAATASTIKQATAKVRRRTIGFSLGKFGLDLTTADVVLDVPSPDSFAAEMTAAGLSGRATSRPAPASGRTPTALDARRGLAAYARDASGPASATVTGRTLGTA